MLVTEVAEQEGVDPTRLTPPIHTTVDMDALGKLFSGGNGRFVGVEFSYAGHRITIEGEEELRIEVE